ncbi:inorganic phosphate transporter [Natronosalvus halobius]|uniref:inorganic phosphate transporter n=1 Tax=Natronosalvus halobius TaxID=2953746 RepID=UPI0020A0010B|nr:inorganic phosphate transporter [Natronosalvus halobius]USZ72918.1 anion permease [Natronosalvus halobius]
MPEPLLIFALLIAVFVGFNIGGSTTAPAFGPAVGASLVPKVVAGGLMAVFFGLGAATIGRRVVDTLGQQVLHDSSLFTLESSIVILGLIGLALFAGNRTGVPASTSMTTVGAIAGLGVASGELQWATMREIVFWWVVAPIAGFAVSVAIGYFSYQRIADWISESSSNEPLFALDQSGTIPSITVTSSQRDELLAGGVVVAVGCLMAFSSGTSNIANIVAPLIGGGVLDMSAGIVLGSAAVALGALTIARRTIETLGNEIVELPLPAALVASTVSGVIITTLSLLGIPASFVIVATVSIAGLGWSRTLRSDDGSNGRIRAPIGDGGLDPAEARGAIASKNDSSEPELEFDPFESARVLTLQHVIPIVSTVGAYAVFSVAPVY